tara:strand:- start:5419 stop:5982 length:564 start_codon:yes stop_codon:yes gene_type:complete
MQDIEFIQTTINAMLEGKEMGTKQKILKSAADYAKLRKFPPKLTDYNDEQLNKYFEFIEKIADMPEVYTQEQFEQMDIIDKVSSIMGDVKDITPEPDTEVSEITDKLVTQMANQNKYRDDLKCPCPNKLMVWDNRRNKKSDRSPDFVCSGKTPEECPQHTGKWRKSWWLDNSDIPQEWNLDGKESQQ